MPFAVFDESMPFRQTAEAFRERPTCVATLKARGLLTQGNRQTLQVSGSGIMAAGCGQAGKDAAAAPAVPPRSKRLRELEALGCSDLTLAAFPRAAAQTAAAAISNRFGLAPTDPRPLSPPLSPLKVAFGQPLATSPVRPTKQWRIAASADAVAAIHQASHPEPAPQLPSENICSAR